MRSLNDIIKAVFVDADEITAQEKLMLCGFMENLVSRVEKLIDHGDRVEYSLFYNELHRQLGYVNGYPTVKGE